MWHTASWQPLGHLRDQWYSPVSQSLYICLFSQITSSLIAVSFLLTLCSHTHSHLTVLDSRQHDCITLFYALVCGIVLMWRTFWKRTKRDLAVDTSDYLSCTETCTLLIPSIGTLNSQELIITFRTALRIQLESGWHTALCNSSTHML